VEALAFAAEDHGAGSAYDPPRVGGDLDRRIAKWKGWCEGTIHHNVMTMNLHRHAWMEVAALLQRNDDLPESYWWEFMFDTYATTQASAVRRQADTHRDAASLGRMLDEIAKDAERFMRSHYVDLWGDSHDEEEDRYWRAVAAENWDKEFGGRVGTHLDPAIPAADLDALKADAADAKAFVDKHVAHADASAVAVTIAVTLSDVHDAIDTIGRLFQKYSRLFSSADYATLVPVIQHSWKAAFDLPWRKQ
jgi:hypothetical protein